MPDRHQTAEVHVRGNDAREPSELDDLRDALAHLHDLARLQLSPLTRLVPLEPGARAATVGKALRQRLLDAIEALRPSQPADTGGHAWRSSRILTLRYVEGLDVPTVRRQLAISKSEFYRDHRVALAAALSLLQTSAGERPLVGPHRALSRAVRARLPVPVTSFIGRERAVATLVGLLGRAHAGPRLLTLTGPPGVGKTRLALETAARLGIEWDDDGPVFVALAPVSAPELVVSAIAQVLGVREAPGTPLLESLVDALRDRSVLLVLDNFEHVLGAAPPVAELLEACAQVTVCVTSRARLGVYGEHEFPVPPLALPDAGQPLAVDDVTQSEAVRLFVDRARAVRPGFVLTAESAPAVAALCSRLEGLPLAIELAAARSKVFSPRALLARLDRRLPELSGGPRNVAARQQTLRGAIAWSYDLLDAAEQACFRCLAVFEGGWTVEAVVGVGGWRKDDPVSNSHLLSPNPQIPTPISHDDVLDLLLRLVDQSLVGVDADDPDVHNAPQPPRPAVSPAPRFTMFESIREFGHERLTEQGDMDAVQRRHAAYFLALAEAVERGQRSAEQTLWFDRLMIEHGNVRAALRWMTDQGETEQALRLASAIYFAWWVRGRAIEARSMLEKLLASPRAAARTPTRAKALFAAGYLARCTSDYAGAHGLVAEALSIRRELGDQRSVAETLTLLGFVAMIQGDAVTARLLYAEALALHREHRATWDIAWCLVWMGTMEHWLDDQATARSLLEESLALWEELSDRQGKATALARLGAVRQAQRDYAAAEALFEQSLAMRQEIGDTPDIAASLRYIGDLAIDRGDFLTARSLLVQSLSMCRDVGELWVLSMAIYGLAGCAAAEGQSERALRLAGAAEGLRERIGTTFSPYHHGQLERWLAPARGVLGEHKSVAAWEEGRALTLEQAIAEALEDADAG